MPPLPPASSLCTIASVGEVGVWRGVYDNGDGNG
jgi:hypothetical protein